MTVLIAVPWTLFWPIKKASCVGIVQMITGHFPASRHSMFWPGRNGWYLGLWMACQRTLTCRLRDGGGGARAAGIRRFDADEPVDVRQACPVVGGIVELVGPYHDVRRRGAAAKDPGIESSRVEPEELGGYAVPADRLRSGDCRVHDRGQ